MKTVWRMWLGHVFYDFIQPLSLTKYLERERAREKEIWK
jgi:hypothetical protein